MAKRLAIGIFVVLGTFVLLVSGFFLVLFLAPGFSMFGIKYIRADTHKVVINETRIIDLESVGNNFTGSVIINSNEVPVEVCFTNTSSTRSQISFSYYDNYQGITNSDFDDPSLEIKQDESGNVIFNTHEFNKWIYESKSSQRLLVLYIPLAYLESNVGSSVNQNDEETTIVNAKVNLTIKNGIGGIKFTNLNEATAAGRTPKFNNLTIETSGKVDITRRVDAVTFSQTSNNTIVIGNDVTNNVNAIHYNLTSNNGNVVVNRAVSGDLTAKTNNGYINFVSCKNLIATTNNGNISCATEGLANVEGNVTISSKGGSVTLGNVDGSNSKISTGSGNVNINKFASGEITTSFGYVTIKLVNSAKINTNLGKVKVAEALNSIEVNTKRGLVELGGEGMTINNPKVNSTLGKVNLLSAKGKADITTIYSDINFTNAECSEIKLSSGGKIVGRNFSGKVDISASKNVDIEFSEINADVNIDLADTVTFARVVAGKNHIQNTRYYLKAKSVSRFVKAPNGTYNTDATGNELSNSNISLYYPLLKVTGESAEVEVYFNSVS